MAKITPILLVGAGRMGGALLAGWQRADAFAGSDLIIKEPAPSVELLEAEAEGALVNPAEGEFRRAKTVVLAVKPQVWRQVAAEIAPLINADALIVSIVAGIGADAVGGAFGGRRVARVMPTTAAAIGQGTASVYSADPEAHAAAHALFEPVGQVVDLPSEELMHAATAASGSAPAYLYALTEALEAAAAKAGLDPAAARTLARATLTGAAALMAASGEEPAELRRQVTSPGGTTEAALKVLLGEGGLSELMARAVQAAADRSRELGSG